VTDDNTVSDDEKEREWREGFEQMADDPESCDVEYAFAAQSEVVLAEAQDESGANARISLSYDKEADVLYITIADAQEASDSEILDNDVIVRFDHNNHVIGFTVL
jgi:uncharacterized protein YuzE